LLVAVTTAATVGFFSYGCSDQPAPCQGGTLPPETLEQYSLKCNEITEIDVPEFNCDKGTIVPEFNQQMINGELFCDYPNVLNHECDPDSRFQVIAQNDTSIVVAHCRKKGYGNNYGDIAVIQYNKRNGATCFYQALGNLRPDVTRPIEGNDTSNGKFPWLTPAGTAGLNCHFCHDNGPFVRSPYLAQLRDEPKNRLPGTNETDPVWGSRYTWNSPSTVPEYHFVGNDFQSWKVYSVTIQDHVKWSDGMPHPERQCSTCHRMGLASVNDENGFLVYAPQPNGPDPGTGTSQSFGPIATAISQAHKNPHGPTSPDGSMDPTSPIWMVPPDSIYYDSEIEQEAFRYRECVTAYVAGAMLPYGCEVVLYGQGDSCPPTSIQTP
jgi:hypothetical protein